MAEIALQSDAKTEEEELCDELRGNLARNSSRVVASSSKRVRKDLGVSVECWVTLLLAFVTSVISRDTFASFIAVKTAARQTRDDAGTYKLALNQSSKSSIALWVVSAEHCFNSDQTVGVLHLFTFGSLSTKLMVDAIKTSSHFVSVDW